MPLFTRCNIGLGCPHNVSVKFQLPQIIYYNMCNMSFLGREIKKKRAVLVCITLNAYELHIPAPSSEEAFWFIQIF